MNIVFNADTRQQHAATFPEGDAVMAQCCLDLLKQDVVATRDRLVIDSLVMLLGKKPNENQLKKRLTSYTIGGPSGNPATVFEWINVKGNRLPFAIMSGLNIGTDPKKSNRLLILWDFVNLSKEQIQEMTQRN